MFAVLLIGPFFAIPASHARMTENPEASTRPTTTTAESNLNNQSPPVDPHRRLLEDEIRSAESAADKAQASISAARYILVTQCEPELNCLLADDHDCDGRLGALVREALDFLNAASAQLNEPHAQIDDDRRSQLDERIDMLKSFAGVFGALARPASDDDAYRSTLLDACGDLAIYLDDTNAGIVESARLWQGIAYRRAKRFDRAIQVLRPVMPRPRYVRFGFHARLQRCLALSDSARHVNALWLCAKMQGRVDSWFEGEEPAVLQNAGDAARWTRVRLLKSWARDLRADGKSDRAAEAESQADKIAHAGEFPLPPERRLALKESIAGLPPWDRVDADQINNDETKTPVENEDPKNKDEHEDSADSAPPPPIPAHD